MQNFPLAFHRRRLDCWLATTKVVKSNEQQGQFPDLCVCESETEKNRSKDTLDSNAQSSRRGKQTKPLHIPDSWRRRKVWSIVEFISGIDFSNEIFFLCFAFPSNRFWIIFGRYRGVGVGSLNVVSHVIISTGTTLKDDRWIFDECCFWPWQVSTWLEFLFSLSTRRLLPQVLFIHPCLLTHPTSPWTFSLNKVCSFIIFQPTKIRCQIPLLPKLWEKNKTQGFSVLDLTLI